MNDNFYHDSQIVDGVCGFIVADFSLHDTDHDTIGTRLNAIMNWINDTVKADQYSVHTGIIDGVNCMFVPVSPKGTVIAIGETAKFLRE